MAFDLRKLKEHACQHFPNPTSFKKIQIIKVLIFFFSGKLATEIQLVLAKNKKEILIILRLYKRMKILKKNQYSISICMKKRFFFSFLNESSKNVSDPEKINWVLKEKV